MPLPASISSFRMFPDGHGMRHRSFGVHEPTVTLVGTDLKMFGLGGIDVFNRAVIMSLYVGGICGFVLVPECLLGEANSAGNTM